MILAVMFIDNQRMLQITGTTAQVLPSLKMGSFSTLLATSVDMSPMKVAVMETL